MQRILEDINTQKFHQIYLLYGTEDYLRKQYRDKLRNALDADPDSMNLHYYEGKDVQIPAIIDLAETLPFFAEKRIIVLENSELFKKGGEVLADYLKEPCETTVFIFVEKDVDKRSKLFKTITAKGLSVEFKTPDETTLKKWIYSLAKKENFRISDMDILYLLDKVGTDMENIRSELEKLFSYCMGRDVITSFDIDQICVRQLQNQIFDMISAMAEKKQKKAMELYYDLLALKEPPMRILSLISRQYNLLLQVKPLKMKGYDNRKIGEKVGLAPFVAGKYAVQSTRYSLEELRYYLEACVDADFAIKTGRLQDVMSVELLIINCSGERK